MSTWVRDIGYTCDKTKDLPTEPVEICKGPRYGCASNNLNKLLNYTNVNDSGVAQLVID